MKPLHYLPAALPFLLFMSGCSTPSASDDNSKPRAEADKHYTSRTDELIRLRRNADKGDAKAQYELGCQFWEPGVGSPSADFEAGYWFRKAAAQSHAEAQKALAELDKRAVRREAAEREAAVREAAQREAARREAAQREAAQREAVQREAARLEAAAQREAAQREAAAQQAVAAQREAVAKRQALSDSLRSKGTEAVRQYFGEILNGYRSEKDRYGLTDRVWIPQDLFDRIHVVGTAKSIAVTDAHFNIGPDNLIASISLKIALRWDSLMIQSGDTTLKLLYDVTTDDFRNFEIVSSDGLIRQDAERFLRGFSDGFQIGAAIRQALASQ